MKPFIYAVLILSSLLLNSCTGMSGLQKSASEGNVEDVKRRLDEGADPNEQDPDLYSALIHASEYGHFQIVKLLVERRADVNARTVRQETALSLAAANNRLDVVKYLVEHGAAINPDPIGSRTPLISAIVHGDAKPIVYYLLDHGADVNGIGVAFGSGDTLRPVYTAAMIGDKEMVNLLKSRGAIIPVGKVGLIAGYELPYRMELIAGLWRSPRGFTYVSGLDNRNVRHQQTEINPGTHIIEGAYYAPARSALEPETRGAITQTIEVKAGEIIVMHPILIQGKYGFDEKWEIHFTKY